MAKKKKKVNRSAEIRAYLKSNPKAGPKEIKEALAKRKIDVSDALISAVKYAKPSKPGKKARKGGKKKAKAAKQQPMGEGRRRGKLAGSEARSKWMT